MTKILLILCAFAQFSAGDDLYFKSGFALRNVRLVGANDSVVVVQTTQRVRRIPLENILRVEKKPFDPLLESQMTEFNLGSVLPQIPLQIQIDSAVLHSSVVDFLHGERLSSPPNAAIPSGETLYPNIAFLPVGIALLGLSWDFFSNAKDLTDAIEEAKSLPMPPPLSSLEATRDRKRVLGVVCFIAGAADLYFSLKAVKINASANSVRLSYQVAMPRR